MEAAQQFYYASHYRPLPHSPMPPPEIFDRTRLRHAREKTAPLFHAHDFLHRRAMADIVDRLESVTRSFERAAFYGVGELVDLLTPECGVGWTLHADLAAERTDGRRPALVADEERSPFAPESLDLVVSLLTLHDANDLVGALAQWRAALKPDGLFIAALFGEETLCELKSALYRAESELAGGVSPRLPPFASLKDLGSALQRAGFALPVADLDHVTVRYGEPLRLLKDLKGMGETNALKTRARPLGRRAIAQTLRQFAAEGGAARFDIVYLTGWAPHESQPVPLKPGSARRSLAEAVRKSG
ncbi:MAG: class I SAM-dependent methyltransferase [Amphiplicatus sp.]